jgi:hypothetical protein
MGCYNVTPDAHDGTQWTSNDNADFVPHGATYRVTNRAAFTGTYKTYQAYVHSILRAKCRFHSTRHPEAAVHIE